MAQTAHRTHVSSWGYACFLTVNATSIWGGVFPFLPLEFQTAQITLTFFLAQALAFGGAFVASMFGSYYFPRGARVMLVSLSAILVFAGSACLIAAMYVSAITLVLVAGGGVLLGIIESLSKAYISSQMADAIVFGVLIIVLLVRPAGILGKQTREKV